jgi:hypothetical protein
VAIGGRNQRDEDGGGAARAPSATTSESSGISGKVRRQVSRIRSGLGLGMGC